MKKLLVLVLLSASLTASAQHRHWYGPGWVAPLVIGGVIGYAVTRPQPVYVPAYTVQPTPYYTVPMAPPSYPMCTEWREVQYRDGTIARERTCNQ